MAIDILQEKIRKLKNPTVVDFTVLPTHIPPHLLQGASRLEAYGQMCRELLSAFKGVIPAVRFSLGSFALYGAQGIAELTGLLNQAKELGFYVFLDGPELLSPWAARNASEGIFGAEPIYPCDGLILSPYLGTDVLKPFLDACKASKKDLFPVVRSANKSAPELQDLLTGGRLVHTAAADIVSRCGQDMVGKFGYSQVGMVAAVTSQNSLRTIRSKYKNTFLLADGLDYPSGFVKSCALAFDRLGHGAAVCAGGSVVGAWQTAGTDGQDYIDQALKELERIRTNLMRYITIM